MVSSLRALGLYAVLTALLTWPLAANLTVMDPGDSAFFAWEIGWTVHALKTDPLSLPNGNIFHPLRYTLGMDEPVLGSTVLVLPLALFTDDAVLLYNVLRLLSADSGLAPRARRDIEAAVNAGRFDVDDLLSLIHISEPTRH